MSRPAGTKSKHSYQSSRSVNEETPLLSPFPLPETTDPFRGAVHHQNGSANGLAKPTSDDNDDEDNQPTKPAMGLLRTITCVVALGLLIFFQATNISMLTTTTSDIARDLDAYDKTSWLTSAYLISMSSLTPLMGKLASIFSPRICILLLSVVMALGTIVCSFAPSFETFVIGRVITGMGGGGTFTISMIIGLEISGPHRRGIAIGLLNSGYTLGVAVGATAAGALLPHLGWRPLFWLQAPFVVLAGATLLFAIPADFVKAKGLASEQSTLQRLARVDYLGAATLTASIVLVLLSLSSPKEIPIFPIVLAAVVFVTFVMIELHLASDPIIPVTLLKSRGLLLTCLAVAGSMMARWSVLFYTPTYAIAVRQWQPAMAGSILIPTNAGFAAGGLLVGWLHVRRPGSFYLPTLITYILFPVTLIALAILSTQNSNVVLYIVMVFLNGAITGSMLNYSLAHLLHLTPPSTHFVATALTATFRGFAGSFGSAIGGGIFTRTLYNALQDYFADRELYDSGDVIHKLLGQPDLVRRLPDLEKEAAVLGYQDAIRMLFLAAAGLGVLVVFVQAGVGWKAPEFDEDEDEDDQRGGVLEEEQALLAQRREEEGINRENSSA